jgi:hypothetical protein
MARPQEERVVNSNRADLIGLVSDYLDALAASDPARLPVTNSVKFTEMAQALRLGEGLWTRKIDRMPGGQYFADPMTGQAACFAALKVDRTDTLIMVRLRIVDGKIDEIETVVVPKNDFMFNAEVAATPRAIWTEDIPPAERRPRSEMFRIMNLYFEGIEQVTGEIIPVSREAFRLENGTQASSNPNPPAHLPPFMHVILREGIAEQLTNRRHTYISAIRDRRYLLADEERGITFGIFLFDQPGRREDGSETVTGRSTMIIPEAFKIRNGIIQQVEAVGTALPYGAQSGWSWTFAKEEPPRTMPIGAPS